MKHTTHDGIDVYRIGYWTRQWWPSRAMLVGLLTGNQPSRRADNGSRFVGRRKFIPIIARRLKLIRRPHRPWQAEYENCRWCRRGWTAASVRRKAGRDRAYQQTTGLWAPWIQRKVRRRYGAEAHKGPVIA